jgi:hypothetical protein
VKTSSGAIAEQIYGGGLSWDTVNTIAIDATQTIVATDTTRLDGVRVIDLTPVLDGTGRARLLDLVAGRSAAALTTWLSAQTAVFRDQVLVVAMDGFGGYQTAAANQLSEAPRWRKSLSSAEPCTVGAATCWPTSTTTPPTGRPNLSTAVWKALRRNALEFRNLTHYRIRSLLHCGNLIQQTNGL